MQTVRRVHLYMMAIALLILSLATSFGLQGSNFTNTSPGSTQLATSPPAGTYFDHVVIIVMENEGIQDICHQNPPPCLTSGPSGSAPYMANLANNYTIGEHYLSLINTSQPNYVALLSGSMQACTVNGCPTSTALNLVDRFEAVGLTWKGYFENQGLAQGCDASAPEPYEPIHNPFITFQDITNNTARCNKLVRVNPTSCGSAVDCILINDLNNATAPAPNFMWLTPNDCNNMRSSGACTNGCTTAGSSTCIARGDSYLSSLVPNILNSNTFKTTRSAIFITFDEGTGYCPLNNSLEDCLYAIWVGPVAKNGYGSTNLYNQYSFPKTIEANWGLASMASGDASANAMTDFFKTQSSDFTISPNPNSLTVQAGATATATITLSSLGGFAGTVALSASTSPVGLTTSLSTTSLALSSGGSATSILTVSSSTSGSYTVTVTGTSGSLVHSTTVTVTISSASSLVASDGALGPSSLATAGGQKIIQDSAGKMITIYVDSSGRISLAYANTDPVSGAWSAAVKSPIPTSAYARPAAVLLSLTSLRIIAEGGSASGRITEIPVTVQRDAQNNILGFTFGTATVLDSSGTARYSTAVLAHNGDILLAWAFKTTTTSEVRALRWDPVTGWTNFVGNSTTPDNVLVDNSSVGWMIPSILERPDNNNVYVLANRLSAPPSTLAYNKASWTGASWSWGTQNLNYETNASSGIEDPMAFAWDPVKSVAVVSYGITGTTGFGVFTLTSTDLKTHLDTPSIAVTERDWGTISVQIDTGDYYIFLMNVNTDGGSGTVGYVKHPSGGSWPSTITILDSATNNQALNMRATGTSSSLDLVFAQGTSSPSTIRFARLSPYNPPNFSISASPSSLMIQASSSGTATVTLTSVNSFVGTLALSATASPSGLTTSLNPTSVTLTSGGTASSTLSVSASTGGIYTVTIQATSGSLSHSLTMTVTVADFSISAPSSLTVFKGSPQTSTITLSSLNGFAGTVSLTTSASPSGITASVNPTSVTLSPGGTGTSSLTLSSTTIGTYTITITGTTASLSHAAIINVQVVSSPDFSVTASPATVTFPVGSTGSSTVTLASLNGFAGSLTLSWAVTPASGLLATCTPTSLALTSGSSATSNCSFASSTTGNYAVTVNATNGTSTNSAVITVNVSEFSVSASPASSAILASGPGSSTITLTSLNGFSGTVSLALSTPSGLTASLSQSILVLNSGGTATSNLSFSSTTVGNYVLNVTSTSGSISHAVAVTVYVRDFSVNTNVSSLTLAHGSSGTVTINLASINGFTGTVSLSAVCSPSGPKLNLSSSTISLTSGGSGTSALSIRTLRRTTPGSYAITITANSGGVSHTVTVLLTVT